MNFDSDTNVIEVAVRRLRAKIDDDFEVKLIHTSREWVTCSTRLIRNRNEPNVPDDPHESDVHARGNGRAHGRRTQFQ